MNKVYTGAEILVARQKQLKELRKDLDELKEYLIDNTKTVKEFSILDSPLGSEIELVEHFLYKNNMFKDVKVLNSIKEMIGIKLLEENARIDYNFKTIGNNKETYDYNIFHDASNTISNISDYILWYAKDIDQVKIRKLYIPKSLTEGVGLRYNRIEEEDGTIRAIKLEEQLNPQLLPKGPRSSSGWPTHKAYPSGIRSRTWHGG